MPADSFALAFTPQRCWMPSTSRRTYQVSRLLVAANEAMATRYSRTVCSTIAVVVAAGKPRDRPAISMLAARRFTSHSKGPGRVSSKSLTLKTSARSGDVKTPKFDRWASPHSCTVSAEWGTEARSDAMTSAAPR